MRAAMYIRQMGTDQAGWTEVLKNYCERKGYEPGQVYLDEGYPGDTLNRPALQRMLQDAARGGFDLLLVPGEQQLGNNMTVLMEIGDRLEAAGAELEFME